MHPAGKIDHLLAEQGILLRRHHDLIDEKVIHGGQPGAQIVAPACGLDRGRFAGKDAETMPQRMAGKIDQNIDVIPADHLRRPVILQGVDDPPAIHRLPKAPGPVILLKAVGITEDLKPVAIIMEQQGRKGGGRRMLPEISGNIADAQAPLRVGIVVMAAPGLETGGKARRPEAPFLLLVGGAQMGGHIDHMQQAAKQEGIPRVEVSGLA